MTTAPTHKDFLSRIEQGQARIGVIGLGYVGLPLAHALHGGGSQVIGFDIDPGKPKAIKEGRNYLQHLGDSMITDLRDSKRFEATIRIYSYNPHRKVHCLFQRDITHPGNTLRKNY
jgi:UDP-N-acetyl-D-glucosamine dehydrogenase